MTNTTTATTSVVPQPDFLQNLETQIETAAKALWSKIVAVADAIEPIVETAVEDTIEDLGTIAMNAVITQAPLVISGTEKFGAAVTSVVQTVEAAGKTIPEQNAQVAVQAAYVKAQQVIAAAKTN